MAKIKVKMITDMGNSMEYESDKWSAEHVDKIWAEICKIDVSIFAKSLPGKIKNKVDNVKYQDFSEQIKEVMKVVGMPILSCIDMFVHSYPPEMRRDIVGRIIRLAKDGYDANAIIEIVRKELGMIGVTSEQDTANNTADNNGESKR